MFLLREAQLRASASCRVIQSKASERPLLDAGRASASASTSQLGAQPPPQDAWGAQARTAIGSLAGLQATPWRRPAAHMKCADHAHSRDEQAPGASRREDIPGRP